MVKKLSIILFCIGFIFAKAGLCWDEQIVHQIIINHAILSSNKMWDYNALLNKFNLDKGLFGEKLKYLGLDKPLENCPLYFIFLGAQKEDASGFTDAIMGRSVNHFHNPLKINSEAGLTDISGISYTPISTLLWMQDGDTQSKYVEGDNSWKKLRDLYFNALTSSIKDERENNFAYMFKALGHQLHMLQDMSVPDHVRNHTHILNGISIFNIYKSHDSFRCIEGWAQNNRNLVDGFCNTSLYPQVYLDSLGENKLVPIYNLIDYSVYNGSNPSNALEQGLAEYSNANFVCEDTIFTENLAHNFKYYFPFPKRSSTNIDSIGFLPESITAADGRNDYVRYVKKITDGETVNHFLAIGYFTDKTKTLLLNYKTVFLDDLCHKDYASMLFPRAVGYSAALIDYFFRGEIEISLPTSPAGAPAPQRDGVYAFSIDSAAGFNKISLMAKNVTQGREEMSHGKVQLVVRYREGQGDPFKPGFTIPDPAQKFIVADAPGSVTSIPLDNPVRIDFDLPKLLPLKAVDVTLTLVFKGTLGFETDNAVAIGFKDISEPTAVDFFNDSDYICFNNNHVLWLDNALWDVEDLNNNKILDSGDKWLAVPFPTPLTAISFNKIVAFTRDASGNLLGNDQANYYCKFDSSSQFEVAAGQSFRFYVLADVDKAITFSIANTKGCPISDGRIQAMGCDPVLMARMEFHSNVHTVRPLVNKLKWDSNLQKYTHEYPVFYDYRGLTYYWMDLYLTPPYPESTTYPCVQPPSSCSGYY